VGFRSGHAWAEYPGHSFDIPLRCECNLYFLPVSWTLRRFHGSVVGFDGVLDRGDGCVGSSGDLLRLRNRDSACASYRNLDRDTCI
jgi:hypothetical protein